MTEYEDEWPVVPPNWWISGPLWFRKRGDVLSLAFHSMNVEKGIQRSKRIVQCLEFRKMKRSNIKNNGLVAKLCPTLATPWTVACQAPLSMGFSRQGYWSRLPFPPPGDLPDLGIKPGLVHCRQSLY